MKILLTNDDGIQAEGINILNDYLLANGHEVTIVAPHLEMSASSHSITLRAPLKIYKHSLNQYSVTGTPVDTVFAALNTIMNKNPDLIISGINHGPNMGEDVFYSGTVAAAMEGAFKGIKSIAISSLEFTSENYAAFLPFLNNIISCFKKIQESKIINVNFSSSKPIKGIKFSHLGKRYYKDELIEYKDENGEPYYKIEGEGPFWHHDTESDFYTVHDGFISITPLLLSLTDQNILSEFQSIRDEPR